LLRTKGGNCTEGDLGHVWVCRGIRSIENSRKKIGGRVDLDMGIRRERAQEVITWGGKREDDLRQERMYQGKNRYRVGPPTEKFADRQRRAGVLQETRYCQREVTEMLVDTWGATKRTVHRERRVRDTQETYQRGVCGWTDKTGTHGQAGAGGVGT